jgi:hypothetical protein
MVSFSFFGVKFEKVGAFVERRAALSPRAVAFGRYDMNERAFRRRLSLFVHIDDC